jgi:hypothetical protein
VKIDAPEVPPKMVIWKTKKNWLQIATAEIAVVPRVPTITLSSKFTVLLIPVVRSWVESGIEDACRRAYLQSDLLFYAYIPTLSIFQRLAPNRQ